MSLLSPDNLHRTAKQLLDSGRAVSLADAQRMLEQLVLQVDVGGNIDAAGKAALLTVVNAGSRAFLGGVHVRLEQDPMLVEGYGRAKPLSSAITGFGGRIVEQLHEEHPTIVVGQPTQRPVGDVILHVTWHGWSGGVVEDEAARLGGEAMSLAGVIAGALAVSECFQHCVGSCVAGRREVGLSLWRPDLDWRASGADGPRLEWLPSRLWLLGLGHLGQGYAWSLGMLPYPTTSEVSVSLMDMDSFVEANLSTGLLARDRDLGRRKTRVVSDWLEELGLHTAIVERRFDEDTFPKGDEPRVALAGFDGALPRQLLGGRFERVVDVGLGSGSSDYLDILMHTFPSPLDPETEFAEGTRSARVLPRVYQAEIERLVSEGMERGEAACGMTLVEGVSVAAAFVGATAGALAVADLLRSLHGGQEYSVISLDLRTPISCTAVVNAAPDRQTGMGFVEVRARSNGVERSL